MKRYYWQYAALIALFLLASAYQAKFVERRLEYLLRPDQFVLQPVNTQEFSSTITFVSPQAEEAGVQKGDQLLEVEGRPYTGRNILYDAVTGVSPGDQITVKVRSEQGDEKMAIIELAGTRSEETGGLESWIFIIVFTIALPVFCLLVGFYVAAIRPWDRLAWLFLGLVVCFSQLPTGPDPLAWKGVMRDAAVSYHMLARTTWPLWMLLFGIYFPERLALDKRWPWAKWILILPVSIFALVRIVIAVASQESFALASTLNQTISPFRLVGEILSMMAIGGFFACIGYKSGTSTAPDVKRRLKLMLWGAQITLTPIFILVIIGLFFSRNPFINVPWWVLLATLLLVSLFPVVLAYVIVVQRAMDVRVAIRQGVQYALARNGARVLQALLSIVVVYIAISFALDPDSNRLRRIIIIAVGITLVFLIGRASERLKEWIDRRFFREAYNAEHILSELGEKVRTMVEAEPLLETVAKRVSESLHVPKVAILLNEGGAYQSAYALGYEQSLPDSFSESGATVEKLQSESEPLRVYFDDPDSWIYKADGMDGERDILKSFDAQLLLPLAINEKLPGFISLGPKQSEEPYSNTDLKLLQSVATQTGLALENSRLTARIATEVAQRERLNRELEIAREVQERLFPQKLPSVPGLDYCGACRPALGVGGDYYDFLLLPAERFGIAIGDVSGKGIAAALLMASLQASLRGQAIQGKDDLAELMSNVNRLVYEASAENRYATFFYAQYEAGTRLLTYVNAGHNPPMIFRRHENEWQILRLEAGGAVVGLLPNFPYSQETVRLERGDLLVAFTDGISEAMNTNDEEWGEELLIEVVKQCEGMNAADTLSTIVKAADAFVAGAKQHDDMTLLVARLA